MDGNDRFNIVGNVTDIETTKIALSARTMLTIIVSVITVVASYFIATERVNEKIDSTNKRIDDNYRLLESQQGLIMSNRYKDSIEKVWIEYQIEQLRLEIKK